nr:EKC/KEOPS complex subunit LAGE3 [Chelonoidis abingdonii]
MVIWGHLWGRALGKLAPLRQRGRSVPGWKKLEGKLTTVLGFTLSIPFPSPLEAQIAHGSLAPDPEPRKGGISKELTVTENFLHVRWKADEARILRVSISSFLDHLSLVIETMEMFGPPVPR